MSEASVTYGEPLKRQARAVLLGDAVRALTESRTTSPLVPVEDFDRLLEFCLRQIRKYAKQDLRDATAPLREYWQEVQTSRVGRRDARDLKVLFLSGPEPLNDFNEFAELGVSPSNIWAVEGDREAFRAAVGQLRSVGARVKLHHGSLHEFFAVVPEQFDIVYFDACGPLFGGKKRTDIVLRELFLHQRLAPLSALVTNFAATPRDNADIWVRRLFAWYAARFDQPVYHDSQEIERVNEQSDYREHIEEHLEQYYSDFVTRFPIEFASLLLPWWRIWALPAAKRMYFAADTKLTAATAAAFGVGEADTIEELFRSIGHAQLAPAAYPYSWLVKLVRENLDPDDPVREFVFNPAFNKVKLSDAISAVSLIRRYFDGFSPIAKHNWDACSPDLSEVLGGFRWFDSEGAPWYRLFCDEPSPNLLVDLLVGVYGYPYHVNLAKLRRIAYRAKQTTMFSDVFVLDQCRYMYDFVPTLPLIGPELPFWLQLTLRICMDLIRRHTYAGGVDLYHGSALAAWGEAGFEFEPWPERKELT